MHKCVLEGLMSNNMIILFSYNSLKILYLKFYHCLLLAYPRFGQDDLGAKFSQKSKQECIPVGCVPPARRPYLPGPGGGRGGVPGPGGCTWSRGGVPGPGGYLVRGGVPGPWGVYLVPGGCTWSRGGVPGPGGGCTWSKGGYLVQGGLYLVPGGVPGPGGCTWSWGGGCTWPRGVPGQVLPPVNRITHTCKNITLPQLRCGR